MRTPVTVRGAAFASVVVVVLAFAACSNDDGTAEPSQRPSTSSAAPSTPGSAPSGSQTTDTSRVTGRHLDLELDDRAERALLAAGVLPVAHDPATTHSVDELRFPITGGRIGFDPLLGSVRTKGSGTLTKAGARVRLSALVVDFDDEVLRATVDGAKRTIGRLDLSEPEVEHTGAPVADVDGVDVTLTKAFVRTLNDRLGTSVPTTNMRAELELHVSMR